LRKKQFESYLQPRMRAKNSYWWAPIFIYHLHSPIGRRLKLSHKGVFQIEMARQLKNHHVVDKII
jgi:hypothetical protein